MTDNMTDELHHDTHDELADDLPDELIIRLAARGDGMTESGRGIPLSAPGDMVTFDAQVIPGPHHVDPVCKHFPGCGGCQLQHVDDAAYGDYLIARIRDALTSQLITPPEIRAPHISPPGARRRATLHAEKRGKELRLGFLEKGSHKLVDLNMCPVMDPVLWALIKPLKKLLTTAMPGRGNATIQLDRSDQGIAVLLGKFPVEGLAAVAECDVGTRFVGNVERRFEGAVAAADDQYVLALVLPGFDQPVDDLGVFFAADAQLARRAAATDGKQDVGRRVAGLVAAHREYAVVRGDFFHPFAETDIWCGLVEHAGPDFHQFFLADFADLDFADQWQLHGGRHDQLVARVVIGGAAE